MSSNSFCSTQGWVKSFRGYPFYCNNEQSPGNHTIDDEWHLRTSTPDQLRIEKLLERHLNNKMRILHVGIGNSLFAKRFSDKVDHLVGISVSQAEVENAENLRLRRYTAMRWNKFVFLNRYPTGYFDVIVDNNPTSYACCIVHLANMLKWYNHCLSPTGMIFTDRVGLEWGRSEFNAKHIFHCDFDTWASFGNSVGLKAIDVDSRVYALTKNGQGLKKCTKTANSFNANESCCQRRLKTAPIVPCRLIEQADTR